MFVPVACNRCGKPFQVPEAAAGSNVACPWCQATVPALPVAGVASPPASAGGSPDQPEPLSLDDAEPLAPPRPARRPFPFLTLAVGLVLVVVVAGLTVAVLGYGSGRLPASAWRDFTAPDESFAVFLPGTPTAEKLDPDPAIPSTGGGEIFATRGWYSRARAWVGYRELDPAWAKQAAMDRDGIVANPLLALVRDRRKAELGATSSREAGIRVNAWWGSEVEMDTPTGKVVERYLVVPDGPRPRLYLIGLQAKKITADSPAARKLFNSFRVAR